MKNKTKKAQTGELIPAKKGRKSLYKPHHKDELIDFMRQGKSATQVAAAWGISRETLHRWLREKKELREAYATAKTAGEAFWEDVGNAAIFGKIKGFNTKVFEMNMRNRFGWGIDKNPANQTINIENMNVSNMTEAELDKQIEMKMKDLKLLRKDEDGKQNKDSKA